MVKLLKPGAAGWVIANGAVAETGNGWYELDADAGDLTVQGEYILMALAAGAEPSFTKFDVVLPDPYAYVTLSPTERNALADATLVRAFASVAAVPARCMLQALRAMWAWRTAVGGAMTVLAEDGTPAWQASTTSDPNVKPIRGMDPQ
jgi:hypothetical protein